LRGHRRACAGIVHRDITAQYLVWPNIEQQIAVLKIVKLFELIRLVRKLIRDAGRSELIPVQDMELLIVTACARHD